MDAVIMCAGRGKRLMPLTKDKPKCMINIKDKPIIQWQLDILNKLDIDNIHFITGYKEDIIKDYIMETSQREIGFIHQEKQTGTADAIHLAETFIDGDFIVLSGDIIYKLEDIKKLVNQNNCLLYTEMNNRLYEYGTLDLGIPSINGEGFKIMYINEKSSRPTSNLVNCGAYHFTEEVFKYISKTPRDNRFKEKIITNSINLMINDGIEFWGIWSDVLNEISYPEDIKKVEIRL